MKIKKISIFDKEYPEVLKNIPDPPIKLYVLGDYKLLNDFKIAIIGCRQYSNYGRDCANYFSGMLAKRGTTIVSGLAKRY